MFQSGRSAVLMGFSSYSTQPIQRPFLSVIFYEILTAGRCLSSRIFTRGMLDRVEPGAVPEPTTFINSISNTMKPFSVAFWSLVFVTALVSYRWGSMVALIFFVALLMTGALVASHLAVWPP